MAVHQELRGSPVETNVMIVIRRLCKYLPTYGPAQLVIAKTKKKKISNSSVPYYTVTRHICPSHLIDITISPSFFHGKEKKRKEKKKHPATTTTKTSLPSPFYLSPFSLLPFSSLGTRHHMVMVISSPHGSKTCVSPTQRTRKRETKPTTSPPFPPVGPLFGWTVCRRRRTTEGTYRVREVGTQEAKDENAE